MSGSEFIQKNYLNLRKNTSNLKDICAFFVENGTLTLNEIDTIQSPFVNPSRDDRNENLYQILMIKDVSIEILNQAFKTSGNSQFLEKNTRPLQNVSSGPSREIYQSQDQMEGQSPNTDKKMPRFFKNIKEFLTAKPTNFSDKGASAPPGLNLDGIEIKDASFRLDEYNVEILSSLKHNYTVKDLVCYNISAKKIPEIKRKFKAIKILIFWHSTDSEKCTGFNSIRGDGCEDCIFKMPQMNTLENLKMLTIRNLEINIGDVNIEPLNLPNLKTLNIYGCVIRGNLIDRIVRRLLALEKILLWGNVPLLEKNDVETLLRIKSLKYIHLNIKNYRQVIAGSFAPIGPDGKLFPEIFQNAEIVFKRNSNSKPWKMTMIGCIS